jgi:hypothetical protein
MTTDLYTKAVLTVIAISLSGIAVQLTTNEAYAQQTQRLKFAPNGALMVSNCMPVVLKNGRDVLCGMDDSSSTVYQLESFK